VNPDLALGLISAAAALVSAGATGGVVYGLLRGDVTRTATDMCAVKKALGLEPSNGEIKTAFVPRGECALLEANVTQRVDSCEERLQDHEYRLTAVETRRRGVQ
jgi:hypothetical protein